VLCSKVFIGGFVVRTLFFVGGVVSILLVAPPRTSAEEPVVIYHHTVPLGGDRWEYTYDVHNHAFILHIDEFVIWFEVGRYANLAVTTPDPPASGWDQILAQPDPLRQTDGFFDALVIGDGIAVGQHAAGFRVEFDWLGEALPGSQPFAILDPGTYQVLASGMTRHAPEPAGLGLLGLAVAALTRTGRRHPARAAAATRAAA